MSLVPDLWEYPRGVASIGARGAECPSWWKNLSKIGKRGENREKERKKTRKRGKSGRKGQNQKGSFTLPSWQIGLATLLYLTITITGVWFVRIYLDFRIFLNNKVVLRIYFSSGKGRKLSLKKRKTVVLHRKKESGIICNLTVANGSLHVPIFLSFLIVVDSF